MTFPRPTRNPHRKGSKGGASDDAHRRRLFEQAIDAKLIVGLDPDCKNVGMSGLHPTDGFEWVGTTHVKDAKGQQAGPELFRQVACALETWARDDLSVRPREVLVIVEAMRIRRSGEGTKNPQSLVDVGFCGGMAAGAALSVWPHATVVLVEPGVWKGTVPKPIHHARLLSALEWEHEVLASYARPTSAPVDKITKVNKADWKHVMDGMGLALWGAGELKKAQARLRREARR